MTEKKFLLYGFVVVLIFLIIIISSGAPKEDTRPVTYGPVTDERQVNDTIEKRKEFAKIAENFMLDKGIDVEFSVSGKNYTTLKCKYILAGRVLVHRLSKDRSFLNLVESYGFKKFTLTDGYNQSWTWTFK